MIGLQISENLFLRLSSCDENCEICKKIKSDSMDEKCAENDFYCSILKEQISLEISEMEIGRSDNGETGGHLTSQFWKFHAIEARI